MPQGDSIYLPVSYSQPNIVNALERPRGKGDRPTTPTRLRMSLRLPLVYHVVSALER
jgi:hypothetical protein